MPKSASHQRGDFESSYLDENDQVVGLQESNLSVVFPDMVSHLPTGTPGGERRSVIAQLPRAQRKLARSELTVTGFEKTGGSAEPELPYVSGPRDLGIAPPRLEWLGMAFFQVTMDAKTFVRLNDGMLTVRGFPWDIPTDNYEPFMSNRTLIQYWFDDLSTARLGHMVIKLEPADKPNVRITHPNWVSPWGCDSILSDYKMVQCPEGTVTIGFLRPLKRDNLGYGYWRRYENLPTK